MPSAHEPSVRMPERDPEVLGVPVPGVQPQAQTVSFVMLGPPVGKQRARTFLDKRVGKIISKTPKETVQYEKALALQAWQAVLAFNPSWGKEGKWPKDARYSMRVIACWADNRRRDIDNVLKSVADACNERLWLDDSQVHHMAVTRVFEGEPRTEVTVEVLP